MSMGLFFLEHFFQHFVLNLVLDESKTSKQSRRWLFEFRYPPEYAHVFNL